MTRKMMVGASLGFLLWGTLAHAAGPVDVEANSMQIDDQKNQATFTGSVVANRNDQKMQSDVMVVDYAKTKQTDGTSKTDVSNIDAKGNVTITTKTQVITGEWAKLNVKANTLQVGGNVKVVQGKTVLHGDKLDVNLDNNNTVMSGGRVKGVFVPK